MFPPKKAVDGWMDDVPCLGYFKLVSVSVKTSTKAKKQAPNDMFKKIYDVKRVETRRESRR